LNNNFITCYDKKVQVCLNDASEAAVKNAGEFGGYALQENLFYECTHYPDILLSIVQGPPPDPDQRYHADYVYYIGVTPPYLVAVNPFSDQSLSKKCLEEYILIKTADCVANFSLLQNKGWIPNPISGDCGSCVYSDNVGLHEIDNLGINVELGNNVIVEFDIPREFNRDNNEFQIGTYTHTIDFDFDFLFEQINNAIISCGLGKTMDNIESDIQTAIGANNYAGIYEVSSSEKRQIIFPGKKRYSFIINKGEYRFKFGLAC